MSSNLIKAISQQILNRLQGEAVFFYSDRTRGYPRHLCGKLCRDLCSNTSGSRVNEYVIILLAIADYRFTVLHRMKCAIGTVETIKTTGRPMGARQNSSLPHKCGVPRAGRNAAFMRKNWAFEEISPAPAPKRTWLNLNFTGTQTSPTNLPHAAEHPTPN
jgi:hypothetical protein